MQKLSWIDAVYLAAGLGAGAGTNALRHYCKEKDSQDEDDWRGAAYGAAAAAVGGAAGLILDSKEITELGVGFGVGTAAHEVVHHVKRGSFKPVRIMGESTMSKRWEGRIEIDPSLPDSEKEKLIIPLLRDLAAQASPFPMVLCRPEYALPPEVKDRVVHASAYLSNLLGIQHQNPPTMIRVQKWFHSEMVRKMGYEGEESSTHPDPALRRPDVDRFRLLPLILDVWQKEGIVRADCDDTVAILGGVAFYNQIPSYFGVFSQKPDKNLHHVAPILELRPGELWVLECIKEIPAFPIAMAKKIYRPLTRFVLVYPDGHYEEQM